MRFRGSRPRRRKRSLRATGRRFRLQHTSLLCRTGGRSRSRPRRRRCDPRTRCSPHPRDSSRRRRRRRHRAGDVPWRGSRFASLTRTRHFRMGWRWVPPRRLSRRSILSRCWTLQARHSRRRLLRRRPSTRRSSPLIPDRGRFDRSSRRGPVPRERAHGSRSLFAAWSFGARGLRILRSRALLHPRRSGAVRRATATSSRKVSAISCRGSAASIAEVPERVAKS